MTMKGITCYRFGTVIDQERYMNHFDQKAWGGGMSFMIGISIVQEFYGDFLHSREKIVKG